MSGGFDHLAFDERRGRLFATASDQGTVEVVDLGKGAKVLSLTGFVSPHNIVIRSGRPTILIVDSEASKSRLIDAATLRTIRDLPLELGANCTLYDARTNRLYVTTGGDRVKMAKSTIIAIDPDTGKVLQSAELPSIHLQPIALDPANNRLFVDMADTNMVAVVDAKTLRLRAQWPVGKAERNSAIAFDALHHRLFVIGRRGFMTVLNADTGAITQTVDVPTDSDDIAFDAARHRVYVPGGDGLLGVYDVSRPDQTVEIKRLVTPKGARTGLLISSRRQYIVAAPTDGSNGASLVVFNTL
ncbi:YncE family protein [Sphingobium estronivorans]|uniref:YncE family protein n=1 Tax=Sphingobium estronivorans TaxID=1577690 RepID=UPI0013C37129|nr:YncE family protein [Sphingobium estronivorans]